MNNASVAGGLKVTDGLRLCRARRNVEVSPVCWQHCLISRAINNIIMVVKCQSMSPHLLRNFSEFAIKIINRSPCVSWPLPWWVLHGRGYVHIRIGLLPVVVSGDYLASVLTLCLLCWLLVHVRCQMIQGCTSTSSPLSLFCVCTPEGYASWSPAHPLAW